MSTKNQIIWLEAPLHGEVEERIESCGHRCLYCYGEGGFVGDTRLGERWTTCPVCKGSGKMDAEVIIKWKASEKGKVKSEKSNS